MIKNILALDLGKGSLGMALSRSGMFVTPLNNLRFPAGQYQYAIDGIKEVMLTEDVDLMVIGLPLFPSGDPCEMTPIVISFIDRLHEAFPSVPVMQQDERNSTVEAAEMLHANGKNAKAQRKNIDSAAATIILERFLKSIGQMD